MAPAKPKFNAVNIDTISHVWMDRFVIDCIAPNCVVNMNMLSNCWMDKFLFNFVTRCCGYKQQFQYNLDGSVHIWREYFVLKVSLPIFKHFFYRRKYL